MHIAVPGFCLAIGISVWFNSFSQFQIKMYGKHAHVACGKTNNDNFSNIFWRDSLPESLNKFYAKFLKKNVKFAWFKSLLFSCEFTECGYKSPCTFWMFLLNLNNTYNTLKFHRCVTKFVAPPPLSKLHLSGTFHRTYFNFSFFPQTPHPFSLVIST